jgi:hypothetical protein
MADFYSSPVNNPPALRGFLNMTTTVSYGQVMCWATDTILGAAGDTQYYQYGYGAVMCDDAQKRKIPAGVVWGDAGSAYATAAIVASGTYGLLAVWGLCPLIYTNATVSVMDILNVDSGNPGYAFASNTHTHIMAPLGRALTGTGTTGAATEVICWLNVVNTV